jgi:hypothetical protein
VVAGDVEAGIDSTLQADDDYVIVFQVSAGKIRAAWEVWKDQLSVDEFWS